MGGFESSYHINRHFQRVDMQAVTQHDVLAREDYRLLKEFGISTARDGIRWTLVDRGGYYLLRTKDGVPVEYTTGERYNPAERRSNIPVIMQLNGRTMANGMA